MNVAYQRDIGFSTTAEAAYVGNSTRNGTRTYSVDVLPLYVFADPQNQFNQAALSQNYLFTAQSASAGIDRQIRLLVRGATCFDVGPARNGGG